MAGNFTRTVEDFTCEECGFEVKGNGYTDHCPRCLWSKHVDVNPGDRASDCLGMMEPIRAESQRGEKIIIYRCTKCWTERRVTAAKDDDQNKILDIVQ